MRRSITCLAGLSLAWVVFFSSVQARAQEAPGPRLIQFSGVLKDHLGQPLTGVQGVTFSLYKEQSGGAPLWLETQNVALDEQGRYSVLLGATASDGLPLEFFSSGEARWLGVQVNLPEEQEQSRVLLVSVPYALKAADAETLGGLPASAFVLTNAAKTAVSSTTLVADKAGLPVAAFRDLLSTAALSSAGQIAKFLDGSGTLGDSIITESGGNIGIGTTTPGAKLEVKGSATGNVLLGELGGVPPYGAIGLANSLAPGSYNFTSSADDANLYINRTTGKDIKFRENNGADQMTILSGGNVGIGTTSPTQKLDVEGNVKVTGTLDLPANGLVAGSNQLVLAGGNLGIGTANPTEKLEVAGTVKATGLNIIGTSGGIVVQNNATSPNIIGGYSGNSVNPGVVGAVIAGGGGPQ